MEAAYLAEFPEPERVPFANLARHAAENPAAHFFIVREGEEARGFLFCVEFPSCPGLLYVAYFAVFAPHRGLGIGSAALGQLAKAYPQHVILLDVEAPESGAPNAAQRERRVRFYGRHGWRRSGKTHCAEGMTYETLSPRGEATPERLEAVALGFWERVA